MLGWCPFATRIVTIDITNATKCTIRFDGFPGTVTRQRLRDPWNQIVDVLVSI